MHVSRHQETVFLKKREPDEWAPSLPSTGHLLARIREQHNSCFSKNGSQLCGGEYTLVLSVRRPSWSATPAVDRSWAAQGL